MLSEKNSTPDIPQCLSLDFPGHSFVLSRFSCIQLFATPWTVAFQAPLSMGFSRQYTGVDCHFLLQGIVPTQGSNLFMSFALAGGFFTISAAWEAPDESFIFCLSKVTPDMLWLKQSP